MKTVNLKKFNEEIKNVKHLYRIPLIEGKTDQLFLEKEYMFDYIIANNVLHFFSESEKIRLPEDCSGLFRDCKDLKDTAYFENFDTSNVKNMDNMFEGCESLTDITNLSGWNLKNVESASNMFSGCNSIKKSDISDSLELCSDLKKNLGL